MRAVLLGPPNAGKGVAGEYLSSAASVPCVSTGHLLRTEVAEGTEIGLRLKPELDNGRFAPDAIVEELIAQFLRDNRCFALDGFPRNVRQAEFLDAELLRLGCALNVVVYLNAADDVIVQRALTRLTCADCRRVTSTRYTASPICEVCGGRLYRRDDDTEETVRARLEVYRTQTRPLLAFYSSRDLIEEVDAACSIPELYAHLKAIVRRFDTMAVTA